MSSVNKFLCFLFLLLLFLPQTTEENKTKTNKILIPYGPDLKLKRMALEAAYALEDLLLCAVCASHRRGLIEIGGDTCRASEISVWTSAINAGILGTDSFLCQTSAGIWVHWIRLTVFNPPSSISLNRGACKTSRWWSRHDSVCISSRNSLLSLRVLLFRKFLALYHASLNVKAPLSLYWVHNSHIAFPISLEYLRS